MAHVQICLEQANQTKQWTSPQAHHPQSETKWQQKRSMDMALSSKPLKACKVRGRIKAPKYTEILEEIMISSTREI